MGKHQRSQKKYKSNKCSDPCRPPKSKPCNPCQSNKPCWSSESKSSCHSSSSDSCSNSCSKSDSCNSCSQDLCKYNKCNQGRNLCSMLPFCVPTGMWCDTMSCIVPCDKVYRLTNNVQVRVNLYCNPFNDIVTANGVAVFGCVDLPPRNRCAVIDGIAASACQLSCPVTQNLYEKIGSSKDLSILFAAINKVGGKLVKYLKNCKTTATFYAPNNKAFEDLATQLGLTLEQLLELPQLNTILLNHILPRVIYQAAYRVGQKTKVMNKLKECLTVCKTNPNSCNGQNRLLVSSAGTYKSVVVSGDILATNGVIAVVDKVLLP